METLSRLWMPAGNNGFVNSIGDFIFNIATLLSWDCYQLSSFKHCWNMWLMKMFTRLFFGCYFWVRIFLIIIIWICSFGKDNCFYQCVAIVGSQFAFFYCPYKMSTPVFCKPWFSSQSLNKTTLLFLRYLHTYLYSCFHDYKHENLVSEVTLKSSLDCCDHSRLYAHCISNLLIVIQLTRLQDPYSFGIFIC